MRAQVAFETLVDPARRAEYDVRRGEEAMEALEAGSGSGSALYDDVVVDNLRKRIQRAVHTSSDLAIRLDATGMRRILLAPGRRHWSRIRPLDFTLSHSITTPAPYLGTVTDNIVRYVEQWLLKCTSSKEKVPEITLDSEPAGARERAFHLGIPTVTISGSVYGLVEEMFLIPITLLSDRYQPLLPLTIPRHRVIQLAENRLSPLITLKYRQEVIHRATASLDPFSSNTWAVSAIELESDILPSPSITTRVSHTFVPNDNVPVNIEGSFTTGRHISTRPRVGLGVHRRLGHGTAFARLDSGDWTLWPGDTCKFFTEFSRVNKRFFYAEFPMKTSPSFEIGYKTTPCERGTTVNYTDCPRGESGMRGLDHELNFAGKGSWTAAAAMTADSISGYIRYGKDLILPSASRPMRVEIELCSNTLFDRYVAIRNLFPLGKTSRLGIELGISEYNLHLSLYWSRLNQRIGVPLLLSPRAHYSAELLFWAGLVPFLAAAGVHFAAARPSSRKPKRDISPEPLAAHISKRRAEADELTVLMHPPVEARQKHESSRGGLVIQSAKFGLKHGSGEDVADVTVAVAALVEDGRLCIPSGLRKGHIPGFWDPAPGKEKILQVRYMWKGKEGNAEVRGREELVLPPI